MSGEPKKDFTARDVLNLLGEVAHKGIRALDHADAIKAKLAELQQRDPEENREEIARLLERLASHLRK